MQWHQHVMDGGVVWNGPSNPRVATQTTRQAHLTNIYTKHVVHPGDEHPSIGGGSLVSTHRANPQFFVPLLGMKTHAT